MPLESATYLSDLNIANPAATDGIKQGDDHIRLIKQVLKNTFPNVNGAVTSTDEQLSALATIPVGLISIWYGSSGSVPAGWSICDGSTVNKSDGSGTITTPDLRDRVVVGAGTSYTQGSTGGATTAGATSSAAGAHSHTATTSTDGSHNHTGVTGDTSLTEAQIPAHKHGNGVASGETTNFGYGSLSSAGGSSRLNLDGGFGSYQGYTSTVGSGSPHSHVVYSDGSHNHSLTTSSVGDHSHSTTVSTLQPYLALHFVMKI